MAVKLIPDWQQKLTKAWSARLAYAGIALSIAEQVIPQLDGVVPRWAYLLLCLSILGARVIKQEAMNGTDKQS